MLLSFDLFETVTQIFGNAPHLFLSIISQYQTSSRDGQMPSLEKASGRHLSDQVGGGNAPEPPAAPPIIILSENSIHSGSQPQVRDPESTMQHTSSKRCQVLKPNDSTLQDTTSAPSSLNPKPAPEPHPAPPVIILSKTEHPASSSSSATVSTGIPPSSVSNDPEAGFRLNQKSTTTQTNRKMGSKASKLSRKDDQQAVQEQKDKEEMAEPTNYYTHRSKSMRRKAGKEGAHGGAGGVSMGSGGAGGGM